MHVVRGNLFGEKNVRNYGINTIAKWLAVLKVMIKCYMVV